MSEELIGALCQLMEVHFGGLTKPIRKNLVALSFAFLLVLSAVRSSARPFILRRLSSRPAHGRDGPCPREETSSFPEEFSFRLSDGDGQSGEAAASWRDTILSGPLRPDQERFGARPFGGGSLRPEGPS